MAPEPSEKNVLELLDVCLFVPVIKQSQSFIKYDFLCFDNLKFVKRRKWKFLFEIFILSPFEHSGGGCTTWLTAPATCLPIGKVEFFCLWIVLLNINCDFGSDYMSNEEGFSVEDSSSPCI